jgi:hypothetical protein
MKTVKGVKDVKTVMSAGFLATDTNGVKIGTCRVFREAALQETVLQERFQNDCYVYYGVNIGIRWVYRRSYQRLVTTADAK